MVLAAALIGFTLFVVLNHHEGLAFFDGSEYSMHIQASGIPHAPGYPLYTLLGKAFSIFSSDPFFVQILISLVSVWLTGGVLYWTFKKRRDFNPEAATVTVLIFLSSFFVKLYTVLPEVFLLNLFLFALLAFTIDRWFASDDPRRVFFVLLVYGLGFSHNHTLALTLPSFFVLFALKYRELDFKRTLGYALLGFALGTLPVWYLFVASHPMPDYTYYFVDTFNDLLFVLLRKGYGTFALTVFDKSAPVSELYALVLRAFFKNLNYVALLGVVPLFWGRPRFKETCAKLRHEPLLVYSLVTLALYFFFFVPQSNIPLTFEKYKNIIMRFVTIPGILMLYPIYFGLSKILEGPRRRRVYAALSAVVLASNAVGYNQLEFSHYDTLDKHIEMGFQTILSQVDSQPALTGNSHYMKCAIFVRPDALVFSIRYFNEFKSPRGCLFFTTASFSGQFRARNEELVQSSVFGTEYAQDLVRYANDSSTLLKILFTRLKQMEYRIFLFYPTDSVVFNSANFRYRPMGNIQELITVNDAPFPMSDLLDQQRRYLKTMDAYLDELGRHAQPQMVLDESVSLGLFQNVNEYKKLTGSYMGSDPALAELDRSVQAKFYNIFHLKL